MAAPIHNPQKLTKQLEQQLPRLCRQVRWTEWEVVSILAGLLPTPPEDAPAPTRQQLVDEAARRTAVRRHVDDAIAEGELPVNPNLSLSQLGKIKKRIRDPALRTQLENAVYGTTLYGQRYTVRPAAAIQWSLSRRDLFNLCPLTDEHLAIARASLPLAAVEDRTQSTIELLEPPAGKRLGERDSLVKRAEWLRDVMTRHDLKFTKLGISSKTAKKIREGKPVTGNTLDRLAHALKGRGVERNDIP